MPTLDWIGKKAVVNHHREVPYRLLHCDREKSFGDPEAGNLLVQGDNLEALKALLPYYAGKVKCIYIDPPYNTGNENWVYNDNVNSPEIRAWLGKVVGKEAEDLSRHDKWLCMMYPRLRLLKEFLREDGVIFVSIDENEMQHLHCILDEIFGRDNRIETFIWKKSYGGGAKERFAITQHEYIFMYAINKKSIASLWLPAREEIKKRYYKYEDEFVAERGPYRLKPLEATKSMDKRENLVYAIPRPDGTEIWPKRQWWWKRERTLDALAEKRIIFSENKNGISVQYKQYLYDSNGEERLAKPFSIIENFYTQQGTSDFEAALGGTAKFSYPKPVDLIKTLIQIATLKDKTSLVMDGFAGSGTTIEAVSRLNCFDAGSRQFIAIEIDEATASRITHARAIHAFSDLESGFRYCTLGAPLFDPEGDINAAVSFRDLAAHVFFCETGSPIPRRATGPLIGHFQGRAIYLLYARDSAGVANPRAGNVLNGAMLADLPEPKDDAAVRVVYAEGCTLSDTRLRKEGVIFKHIPYQIAGM